MERARILIVEDERVVAIAIQDRLEQLGYLVVGNVASGERAIELAAEAHPDLALMDIRLAGGIDGIESARVLRERFDVPSVYLTAYTDEATLERAKPTEPLGYVIKPFDVRMLEVTLEVALYRLRAEKERDRARNELRASETRYRNLAELSPVGIFECDPGGGYRYVNESWCSITGLPADEALDMGWLGAVHEADRARVLTSWKGAVSIGSQLSIEHRFRRPDGSVRVVLTQALPNQNSEGNAAGHIGTVTDLTDVRATQDQLRIRERQLATVAAHLPIFIASVDAELRYRFAAGATESLWGRPAEQVVESHVRDVVGETVFERIAPHIERVLAGHRVEFDLEVSPAGAGRRWLRVSLVPDLEPSGKVIGYFSIWLDVTAQREEEDARRRTEARYAAILDNSSDAIVSADEAGTIVVFNRGAERTFGYQASEVLGRSLEVLVPPHLRQAHRAHRSRFARSETNWQPMGRRSEIVGWRKSGEPFPAEAVVGRIEHDGERLLTTILRDVSARKQLEEQYLRAQKMEVLGRLAGGVAHDFNNVLATIISHVELLKLNLPKQNPLQTDLEEILDNCDRAADLTRHLLILARQQVLEPRIVDVGEVVDRMVKMLRRILGEDIELTIVRSKESPVLMDPGQLEQLVMNLAVNARDAMPGGGELRIEIGEEDVTDALARSLGGIEPGSYVTLRVSDTGCGMAPEVLSRIFEPLFTTKAEGQGTGLGLSTVFGIVDRARGHVGVVSAPGQGSRFTIHLPRSPRSAPAVETAAAADLDTGRETVLVVEDDRELCGLIAGILERCGYKVLRARSGKEALLVEERYDAPIHLLLTDVVMPRMDGYDLYQRLKLRIPPLQSLFISGYVFDPELSEKLSGEPTLQKPFSAAELTAAIRRALGGNPNGTAGGREPRRTMR